MSCECCFTDYLAKCETEVVVNAILTPETEYKWVITVNSTGHKYEGLATTGYGGELVIPVADLPAGLLNQYAGDFTLEIFDAVSCTPIKFKIVQEVDCISFTVKGGTFAKNYLGCEL